MNTLHVFFDSHCRMCRRFRTWLAAQDQLVTLSFGSYRDPATCRAWPELEKFSPDSELVVIADTGEVYQGARAWVMCLWALEEYRELSFKLAEPHWLGLTRKVCHFVSENRHSLSRWIFWGRGEDKLIDQFAKHEEHNRENGIETCTDDACRMA